MGCLVGHEGGLLGGSRLDQDSGLLGGSRLRHENGMLGHVTHVGVRLGLGRQRIELALGLE